MKIVGADDDVGLPIQYTFYLVAPIARDRYERNWESVATLRDEADDPAVP